MSRLDKLNKKLAEIDPSFKAAFVRGCTVLTGESDEWKKIVAAGKLAVDKKHSLGVVNRIKLKGFVQRVPEPPVRDKAYDGAAPDVLVIGGGIVGCAAARALRRYDLSVMLVERGYDVALGGSSRNGGVVHVGINYSPHAQKHIYNNRGNAMYEGLCRDLGVPFEQKGQVLLIGKRWETLLCTVLKLNAKRLHIAGVKFMTRAELVSVEPHIPEWIYGGLYMPTGGITADNLNSYLAFNKVVCCGGSWIVPSKLLEEENWAEITRLCREAVNKMLGFELVHVGINCKNPDEAEYVADKFEAAFGLEKKVGNSSVFASTYVEMMKTPFRGDMGHIAFAANSVKRAVYQLAKRGFEADESSFKYDKNGELNVAYLKDQFGGFAVHLVKRK